MQKKFWLCGSIFESVEKNDPVDGLFTWQVWAWVFDNGAWGTMQVRMDIGIAHGQMPLDQQLILLRIPAADHQVVLRRDEPVEFLKPELLAHLLHADTCFGLQP